jgi:hypothetical protein
MEQKADPELQEFYDLMTAIMTESALLREIILSEEDGKEETEILREFDGAIQAQAFSTLTNLTLYQLRGWRGLLY